MSTGAADAPVVVWFRDDLRVADHPALVAAAESRRPILALYIFERDHRLRPLGAASRWWLAGSLRALERALAALGVRLVRRSGSPLAVLTELVAQVKPAEVLWNRRPDPAGQSVDSEIEAALLARQVAVRTFQAALLFDPARTRTRTGTPFAVFTPFLRHVLGGPPPRPPLPAPARLRGAGEIRSEPLADWTLEPDTPDWAGGLREAWAPGEESARDRLAAFVAGGLAGYAKSRDRPDLPCTSRLSPHLRFGEISPFQIWHAVRFVRDAQSASHVSTADADKFLSELIWREFSYHLLAARPDLARENFQPRFNPFPWRDDAAALAAWQRGRTGYPIVDAGMRELWATGWMHNRVRMLAASFLTKHLLIDWRAGERWFWDTLVDADPANNAAGWQWVAGSGADAAPYFRIFNPVLQGEKFDPSGDYVRRWVPELGPLPDALVHAPFAAPPALLAAAGVTLGTTYPAPIVDHRFARERALSAFARLKGAR